MHGLKQKIHQATGLRLLNVAESFYDSVGPAQTDLDEVLIDFQFVIEVGNLQFFAAQVSAEHLEETSSTAVRFVSTVVVAGCLLDLARQELSLAGQRWPSQFFQLLKYRIAMLACRRAIIQPQRDTCEKQFRQNRLTSHRGSAEKIASNSAKTS